MVNNTEGTPAEKGQRRIARWVRALASIGLFGLTFWATNVGLETLLQPGPSAAHLAKLDALRSQLDEVDLIFAGTSVVHRHIIPEIFDAEMAERGYPIQSFNLGGPALQLAELHQTVRLLADARPARLKWVVISLGQRPEVAMANFGTRRVVAEHTCEEAPVLWREWAARQNDSETWARLNRHLEDAVSHLTGRSLLSGTVEGWLTGRNTTWTSGVTSERGFAGFDKDPNIERLRATRRAPFLASLDDYRATVEAISAPECGLTPMPEHRAETYEGIEEIIGAMGARLMYFAAPELRCHLETRVVSDVPVFDYMAKSAPELFEPGLRFDALHLNREGAIRFTRMLAKDVADWLDQRPEAAPDT